MNFPNNDRVQATSFRIKDAVTRLPVKDMFWKELPEMGASRLGSLGLGFKTDYSIPHQGKRKIRLTEERTRFQYNSPLRFPVSEESWNRVQLFVCLKRF
jgi:hypothetical protein